tara:strand:+ start:56 stop:469 length:414 start_codon:yes stop_codon:yes gene_type:complete
VNVALALLVVGFVEEIPILPAALARDKDFCTDLRANKVVPSVSATPAILAVDPEAPPEKEVTVILPLLIAVPAMVLPFPLVPVLVILRVILLLPGWVADISISPAAIARSIDFLRDVRIVAVVERPEIPAVDLVLFA